MIGKSISHYQILQKLGSGGMGVVYLAEDTRLDRKVALKFLPSHLVHSEEARQRFIQEAKAASALNHANICTVHDIDQTQEGQTFIAMAHYEGQTLKDKLGEGALDPDEALSIARQVAEGLAAAHDRGIVHRDIKPANIFVTDRGRAVILDFGLAKLAGSRDLTKPGSTVGTTSYMSPEQIRGEPVDHRTDIWSLGVVLYEMLFGRRPFEGDYEQAVMYAILNTEMSLDSGEARRIAAPLMSMLKRILHKDASQRLPTAEALIVEVAASRGGTAILSRSQHTEATTPSVAVLPFVNIGTSTDTEYFGDGLAEELISSLSQLDGLRVAARTSSFRFRGSGVDVRDIGRQLQVDNVLEGSVRWSGNRLRVTAQLVKASDGFQLWSRKFDRELQDIFAIQDEISLAIVENLRVSLLGSERKKLVRRYTENFDAYQLYLKGRFYLNKRTAEGFSEAIECFTSAVQLEPEMAPAYAGLADAYLLLARYGILSPAESLEKGKAAALRATELDPTLAEAHASLGYARRSCDWDFEGAEKEFQRALELDSGSAPIRHLYAWFLSVLGRHDEAFAQMNRARALDPLSLIINTNVGTMLYFQRRFREAIDHLRETLELDPDFVVAHQWLGRALEMEGLLDEAIAEHKIAVDILADPESVASLGHAYALAGRTTEARKSLAELGRMEATRYVSGYWKALVFAGLDDIDSALRNLEKAVEEQCDWSAHAAEEPMMDPLRSDPRFHDILGRMGLAPRLE